MLFNIYTWSCVTINEANHCWQYKFNSRTNENPKQKLFICLNLGVRTWFCCITQSRFKVWLPFSLISFFFFLFFNFLSSVLFSFLELIMFCRWLHAKGLLNQSLFSVYLKSLTSHSQLLNATKGPLTDKTIYYTSIRVTELIWKVKFCFHFYISAYRLQSDMIWR